MVEFVVIKRRANADTFNAYLYKALSELIKSKDSIVLTSHDIVEKTKTDMDCDILSNKPQSFVSSEFGELSHKGIIAIRFISTI